MAGFDRQPFDRIRGRHGPGGEVGLGGDAPQNGVREAGSPLVAAPLRFVDRFADDGVRRHAVEEEELVGRDAQDRQERRLDLLEGPPARRHQNLVEALQPAQGAEDDLAQQRLITLVERRGERRELGIHRRPRHQRALDDRHRLAADAPDTPHAADTARRVARLHVAARWRALARPGQRLSSKAQIRRSPSPRWSPRARSPPETGPRPARCARSMARTESPPVDTSTRSFSIATTIPGAVP